MAFFQRIHRPNALPFWRRRQGVALVVVLSALALIAFLVLTILTLNRAEQRAATNSTELTDVRNLAELPTQVVISQIRRATQNLGVFYNWTSQPGLIRVFTQGSASGSDEVPPLQQFRYPLYSTQALYAEGALDLNQENAEIAQWADAKALFVDLNEPVEIRQNLQTGLPLTTAETGTLVFPILDPLALEPFGADNESRIQGLAATGMAMATSNRHPMPMPVRWLYVLSNGKILAPLPSSGPTMARFNMADLQPEGGEPAPRIIGRIAFWTDDESCKINLNTASEPAPWHPPMTASARDRQAADAQPVRGEHHRLAGHPAFTALSPVLRGFGGLGQPVPQLQPQPQPATTDAAGAGPFKDYLTAVHAFLPHTPDRDTGSIHGTVNVEANTAPPPTRVAAAFANVDEFLFDQGVPVGAGALRQRNGFQAAGGYSLDEADIRRARFCLTTHSSAPETNPFNLPKISLWPVQKRADQRTRTDQLMALAATLGGSGSTRAYYGLVRDEAWNGNLPGSAHSTNADLAGLVRNQQLFEWLQTLTALPFPTVPGSFLEKYGERNRDQLLLSMFDLMRWTGNPGNDSAELGPVYDYLAPGTTNEPVEGSGMVAPLVSDTGTGMTLRSPGRVPTITEAAIVFIATNAAKKEGQVEVETEGPYQGFAKTTTEVRAFIVLEPYLAAPGFPVVQPSVKYVLKGLNGPSPTNPETAPAGFEFTMAEHSLHGRPLIFGDATKPYELINRPTFSVSNPNLMAEGGRVNRFGGDAFSFTGLTALFVENDGRPRRGLGIASEVEQFAWASNRIELSATDPPLQLNYTAGDLVLEIRHSTSDRLLQEIALPFTQLGGAIPVPRLHPDDFDKVQNASGDEFILRRFQLLADLTNPDAPPRLPLIKRGDVVRSVTLNPQAPHRGDVRMAATRYQVPREWFAPNNVPPTDPSVYQSHGLREAVFDRVGQIGTSIDPSADTPREPPLTAGSLLPAAPTASTAPLPAVPQGVLSALARADLQNENPTDFRYGDWETGLGTLPDGPFFGRQDLVHPTAQAEARRRSGLLTGAFYSDGGSLAEDTLGLGQAPQRQVASAFIFGALTPYVHGLPEGSTNPEPWRTLLFCPNPVSRTTPVGGAYSVLDHPGFGSPTDPLWLDFFWTPVVEPAFLSPAFSTQGKINMNFQMIPFTWIERSTALHAVFKGVRIPAIPSSARELYKAPVDPVTGTTSPVPEFLYEVNVPQTLAAFRGRFASQDGVFIHPSEICSIHLKPQRIDTVGSDYTSGLDPAPIDPENISYEQTNEWWNGDPSDPLLVDAFELTGDNLRESPYAQIYPRLCTRSNVFKVHYRVQLISKSRGTPVNEWNLETEKVIAEQRGATVIERYLDPNDPDIPDLTTVNIALDEFYRYRILSNEPFTP